MNETKHSGVWQSMADDGTTEIFLFGEIGSNSRSAVTPKLLAEQLKAVETDRVRVRMSSEGGDPFAGLALFNLLEASGKTIETVNDGITASAMTLPFMAGTVRRMSRGSRMMIHRPRAVFAGTSDAFRDQSGHVAEQLQETEDAAAAIYTERSDLELEQVVDMMAAETWFTATKAVESGLATETANFAISMSIQAADLLRWDYEHIPSDLQTNNLDRIESEWSLQKLEESI